MLINSTGALVTFKDNSKDFVECDKEPIDFKQVSDGYEVQVTVENWDTMPKGLKFTSPVSSF